MHGAYAELSPARQSLGGGIIDAVEGLRKSAIDMGLKRGALQPPLRRDH